jgi:hypothetical protein
VVKAKRNFDLRSLFKLRKAQRARGEDPGSRAFFGFITVYGSTLGCDSNGDAQ